MGDENAVSPVIGTLLILAIFTVTVTGVIMVGKPQIVAYQEQGEFGSALNQMSKVMNEARQLSISGNVNEVRQPTMQLPGGDLQVTTGHHVAASVGYFDPMINAVTGHSANPGAHPWLYVTHAPGQGPTWSAEDTAIVVRYNNTAVGSDVLFYLQLSRWTDGQWVVTNTPAPKIMIHGSAFDPLEFRDEHGALVTLSEGPWRIQVYRQYLLSDDVLRGEIFLYDQTRLTYRYSGESGPRAAYGENGGLFIYENNRHQLVRGSLISAPHLGLGGNTLTLRAATFDSGDGASASGRTQLGFLMRVAELESWVVSGGAAVVQLQFSGDFPDLWYTHLTDRGFYADTDPDRGVFYVDRTANPGKHTAFPFNVVFSEIDLRVRQQ